MDHNRALEALASTGIEVTGRSWVLIRGRRDSYPHSVVYSASRLIRDGEGELYPETLNEVGPHDIDEITLIGEE